MRPPTRKERNLILKFSLLLLICLPLSLCNPRSKVKDLGPKLSEFIQHNPSHNWLIKFYAPWCPQCQKIEPLINNVAEKIYNQYDNLIVGRVDCTEHAAVCERFDIQALPTIMFLNNYTQIKYKGSKSESALLDFADRLNGPAMGIINDCKHLKSLADRHGHLVLSTVLDLDSETYGVIKSLASSLRVNWWFYHYNNSCGNFVKKNGLYIVKEGSDRAIEFKRPESGSQEDLMKAIRKWIYKESFPVYGELTAVNFPRTVESGKLLIIAILEEYQPARKMTPSSKEFQRYFGDFARKYSQLDDGVLFLWTTEKDFMEYIAIRHIQLPNVMIMRSDSSYRLMDDGYKNRSGRLAEWIKQELSESNIKLHINKAKLDVTSFGGGDTILIRVKRQIWSHLVEMNKIYNRDPLLVGILLLFPLAVLVFHAYQLGLISWLLNRLKLNDNDLTEQSTATKDHQQQETELDHPKQD